MEQTFFIIKPDGVKRGLVGEILQRMEQRGFKLEKLELRSAVSEDLIDQHYQDLVEKSFYPPIRQFMTSGPVVVGILSGPKVIETWRTMMGLLVQKQLCQELSEEILLRLQETIKPFKM